MKGERLLEKLDFFIDQIEESGRELHPVCPSCELGLHQHIKMRFQATYLTLNSR